MKRVPYIIAAILILLMFLLNARAYDTNTVGKNVFVVDGSGQDGTLLILNTGGIELGGVRRTTWPSGSGSGDSFNPTNFPLSVFNNDVPFLTAIPAGYLTGSQSSNSFLEAESDPFFITWLGTNGYIQSLAGYMTGAQGSNSWIEVADTNNFASAGNTNLVEGLNATLAVSANAGGLNLNNVGTITMNAAGVVVTNATGIDASGSGSPAGANGQVQFNASGSFGANSNIFIDLANDLPALSITGTVEQVDDEGAGISGGSRSLLGVGGVYSVGYGQRQLYATNGSGNIDWKVSNLIDFGEHNPGEESGVRLKFYGAFTNTIPSVPPANNTWIASLYHTASNPVFRVQYKDRNGALLTGDLPLGSNSFVLAGTNGAPTAGHIWYAGGLNGMGYFAAPPVGGGGSGMTTGSVVTVAVEPNSWTWGTSGNGPSNAIAPVYYFSRTAARTVAGIGFVSSSTSTQQDRYAMAYLDGFDDGINWDGGTGIVINVIASKPDILTNRFDFRITATDGTQYTTNNCVGSAADTFTPIYITTNSLGIWQPNSSGTNKWSIECNFMAWQGKTSSVVTVDVNRKVIK